jgi:hypothetical protein
MMVALKPPATPPVDRAIGSAIIDSAKGGRFEFHFDVLACQRGSYVNAPEVMKILSALGPQTSIKALRACLTMRQAPGAFVRNSGGDKMKDFPQPHAGAYSFIREPETKYRIVTTRLAFDWYHLIAVSKDDRLLPSLSEAGIWKILKSDKFTTPLLRPWVPKLIEKFKAKNPRGESHLDPLRCFQCEAALLQLNDTDLDKIVTAGIRSGELKIQ